MNSKRVYFLMLGVVGLLGIGMVAAVYFGDHLLKQRTQKLVSLKLDSRVLDEQQTALVQANKDVAKYAELEKIAKTVVPQEKDQAKVVRQIISDAAASGVGIQNITFPSSTLGQTQNKTGTSKNSTTQLKTVDGIPGLYLLEITVQSDNTKPVSFQQLTDFLAKLEKNRRTSQVSSISVSPDTKNRKLVTFTITVNVYVKP